MSSQADKTRLALLNAAWKRLSRGDAAHLADVARDARVSRQALYLHFGSRARLLVALVAHIDEELGLPKLIDQLPPLAKPDARLLESLRVTARYQSKIHGVAMALVRMHDDADARAAITDRMEVRHREIHAIVRALAHQGSLRSEWTVARASDALWAAGTPSMWELLVVERGWSAKEFERWLIHVGESMLRRRDRD
jgi:AcrR family transcriptional regulator